MSNLMFDIDEISALSSFLETYLETDATLITFRHGLKEQIIESTLNKLDNLTAITYFTRQEYTMMAAAVHHMIECTIRSGNELTNEICELFDKVYKLSGPD